MNSYFKKPNAQQKIWLAGLNAWLVFEDADGETAIFKTEHPKVILELQECIRNKMGGVELISEGEYKQLEDKKKAPRISLPRWREELGGQRKRVMGDTSGAQTRPSTRVAAVAPVVVAKGERPAAVLEGARPTAVKAEGTHG